MAEVKNDKPVVTCPDCDESMVFSGFGKTQGQWWSCPNPDCKRLKPLLVIDFPEEEKE